MRIGKHAIWQPGFKRARDEEIIIILANLGRILNPLHLSTCLYYPLHHYRDIRKVPHAGSVPIVMQITSDNVCTKVKLFASKKCSTLRLIFLDEADGMTHHAQLVVVSVWSCVGLAADDAVSTQLAVRGMSRLYRQSPGGDPLREVRHDFVHLLLACKWRSNTFRQLAIPTRKLVPCR
jgi:hypothetical protein